MVVGSNPAGSYKTVISNLKKLTEIEKLQCYIWNLQCLSEKYSITPSVRGITAYSVQPQGEIPEEGRTKEKKVKEIERSAKIEENIYNGARKLNSLENMLMDKVSVKECLRSLKIKNGKGLDKIPQGILKEGAD